MGPRRVMGRNLSISLYIYIYLYLSLYIYIYIWWTLEECRLARSYIRNALYKRTPPHVRTPTFAPPRTHPHVRTPTFAPPRSHTHIRNALYKRSHPSIPSRFHVRTPTFAPTRHPRGSHLILVCFAGIIIFSTFWTCWEVARMQFRKIQSETATYAIYILVRFWSPGGESTENQKGSKK